MNYQMMRLCGHTWSEETLHRLRLVLGVWLRVRDNVRLRVRLRLRVSRGVEWSASCWWPIHDKNLKTG